MKLSQLTEILNGKLINGDAEFNSVNTDTRTIKLGELFIALKGPNFNGHEFIQQAQGKGAVAALVSESVENSLPVLQVFDTHQALGQLAAWHRQQFDIPVIALTGSCGKTTVKEMLRTVLSECGEVSATHGTLNNDIGVPISLLKINKQHQFAVIEMGANHLGEIAYLTQMAKPTVAFINNIAPAHLEGFGSIEGVARAKSEIFQGLAEQGKALINLDADFADWLEKKLSDRKILKFGIQNKGDIYATGLQADAENRFKFILHTPQGQTTIQLALLGRHNVLNALATASAAYAIGIDLSIIKSGLEKVQPVAGRLVVRSAYNGARIFDDTYNANPASIKAALEVLAQYSGERWFVMGDMREMGADSEKLHFEIGVLAKQLGIQHLYAYGEATPATVKGFGGGACHFASQAELSQTVRQALQPDATVLIKGSRSSKMENVVVALL